MQQKDLNHAVGDLDLYVYSRLLGTLYTFAWLPYLTCQTKGHIR